MLKKYHLNKKVKLSGNFAFFCGTICLKGSVDFSTDYCYSVFSMVIVYTKDCVVITCWHKGAEFYDLLS